MTVITKKKVGEKGFKTHSIKIKLATTVPLDEKEKLLALDEEDI